MSSKHKQQRTNRQHGDQRIATRRQQGFTLVELMVTIAVLGTLSAISIPQYQNYVAKTQVARVMGETGALRTIIEQCLSEGKTTVGKGAGQCDVGWSNSNLLGATVNDLQKPGLVLHMPVTTEVGMLAATFGGNASQTIRGQTLLWIRSIEGAWTCKTTVDKRYKPSGCVA